LSSDIEDQGPAALEPSQPAAPTPVEPAAPSVVVGHKGPLAYSLALAVIVADQLSKMWFLSLGLQEGQTQPVFGPFSLTMVWNQGVSFGLLRADSGVMRWVLSFFSVAVAIVLAVWARKVQRPLLGWAIGLVMGGAIGNMIDRVRFGKVVDFLDFQPLHFPWVFNVADSAISIGVVLLLLDSLLADRKTRAA
jgi:signal peptidase II